MIGHSNPHRTLVVCPTRPGYRPASITNAASHSETDVIMSKLASLLRLAPLLRLELSAQTLIAVDHASSGTNYGMAYQFAVTHPATVVGSIQSLANFETVKALP